MARVFEPDGKGIGEILRGAPMAAAVSAAAEAVAEELRSRGETVYVDYYVTDRAAAAVRIPSSIGAELKNGRLLDAASAAGLEIGGRAR